MLAILFAILSIVSCEIRDNTPSDSSGSNTVSSSESNTSNNDNFPESSDLGKPDESFQETTLIDNPICTIKITKIDSDNLFGYTLKINIQNNSSDTSYTFCIADAAINGVDCDPYFYQDIAAGKKVNADIQFNNSFLKEINIGAFTDIELTFQVKKADDLLGEDILNETVHVYPFGEENATVYRRAPQSTDTILFDTSNVSATVIGYKQDSIWGYVVKVYLVNKTDTTVMFSTEEESVNGYMIDSFFASSVSAQKCAFCEISFSKSDLSDNGISDVTEIGLIMKAFDFDNLFGENFAQETVTLKP